MKDTLEQNQLINEYMVTHLQGHNKVHNKTLSLIKENIRAEL